ncbi:hypothetical protein M407DRAFT_243294 [Tulasnella calospora MUT 4182]|uniref:Uncharacterized protein n=1 Tax=Tulasnella calospora MUT 4182 TaxID=1051891 RepID=A0A0C3QK53_9AGAM|nr:hypothetical protein M407DRAFT_243294 [Tulasnella calospora MUT 4182]
MASFPFQYPPHAFTKGPQTLPIVYQRDSSFPARRSLFLITLPHPSSPRQRTSTAAPIHPPRPFHFMRL